MKPLSRLALFILKTLMRSSDCEKNVKRFGSSYGEWQVCTCKIHLPDKSFMISAGAGEDISFDTELANFTDIKIILVDPTTRSREHFLEYMDAVQENKQSHYSINGKREISEYLINQKIKNSLRFEPTALWSKNGQILLYAPINPNFVSYSIIGNRRQSKENFESVTFNTIVAKNLDFIENRSLNVVKMDIEGSEFEIILKTKEWKKISQFLIEFDAISKINFFSFLKFIKSIFVLQKNHFILTNLFGRNTLWLKEISCIEM